MTKIMIKTSITEVTATIIIVIFVDDSSSSGLSDEFSGAEKLMTVLKLQNRPG